MEPAALIRSEAPWGARRTHLGELDFRIWTGHFDGRYAA